MSSKARRRARRRELTLGQAAARGAAVTIATAVAAFVALILTPNSALRQFWDLASNSVPVSSGSPLRAQIMDAIQREDALLVFPLALLCGGLTVGRLAPRARRMRTVMKAGVGMGALIVLSVVGLEWGGKIAAQGGHLLPGQADRQLVLTLLGCALGWTLCSALGTRLGLFWREAAAPKNTTPPSSTVAAAKP